MFPTRSFIFAKEANMVTDGVFYCPKCGGHLKNYDRVRRIVRTKYGRITHIKIRRLICADCGSIHRSLPYTLFPYKQYEASIIRGVVLGDISQNDRDYEDYPCEMTMKRWVETFPTS